MVKVLKTMWLERYNIQKQCRIQLYVRSDAVYIKVDVGTQHIIEFNNVFKFKNVKMTNLDVFKILECTCLFVVAIKLIRNLMSCVVMSIKHMITALEKFYLKYII